MKTIVKNATNTWYKQYIQPAVLDSECCFRAHRVCKSFPSVCQELQTAFHSKTFDLHNRYTYVPISFMSEALKTGCLHW